MLKLRGLAIIILFAATTVIFGLDAARQKPELKPLAIYYSERSEEWESVHSPWGWPETSIAYSAWYDALKKALDAYEIEYKTIYVDEVEGSLGTDSLNEKYDVIYLHSGFVQPLSNLEKWALANFTWNGGSIIGTHQVGVYNDTDMMHPSNRQFWDIFGVEPVPGVDPGNGSQSWGPYDTIYADYGPIYDEVFGSRNRHPVDCDGLVVGNPYWKQIYVVKNTSATTLAYFPEYLDYPFQSKEEWIWPTWNEAEWIDEPAPAITINEYGKGKAMYYSWEFSKMLAHYWGSGQAEWAEPAGLGCTNILIASYFYLSNYKLQSVIETVIWPSLAITSLCSLLVAAVAAERFLHRKEQKI